MDNKLVHVLRCIRESEAGDAIAAAFRGAKGDVEKRGIGGRENREVIGHFAVRQLCWVRCDAIWGRGVSLSLLTVGGMCHV